MTNKEFDQWLRESLSSMHSEASPGEWADFVHRIEEEESTVDDALDSSIRDALTALPIESTPDWSRMEHMLDADEHAFDQQIRHTIENIEVPYNPSTWPTLSARISEEERLRRRVITAKVLEIAAILFVFLTFYNFFPALKSSVLKTDTQQQLEEASQTVSPDQASIDTRVPTETNIEAGSITFAAPEGVAFDGVHATNTPVLTQAQEMSSNAEETNVNNINSNTTDFALRNAYAVSTPLSGRQFEPLASLRESARIAAVKAEASLDDLRKSHAGLTALAMPTASGITRAFSGNISGITPALKKQSRVRFGMLASADMNTLFFPKEQFYSQGRSIQFSEKEIVTGGYTTGASILFDFKHVMFETGLRYSAMSFGPDRNLFIGNSADRHMLDFENISLDIVSLPMYMHVKLDGRGVWRVYATGGASLHVIASANYDLIAETNYSASAAPPDPQQLQNVREVQRVREHMLDGAKFSSKGYLSAVGGFGVERYLNSRMSVYLQPMYEYQIPFFGLIDQNGKHLQSGSLLLGTRISL